VVVRVEYRVRDEIVNDWTTGETPFDVYKLEL